MPARPSPPATPPPAPRSGVGIVAREPLLARLVEARRLRCIVVRGPAGAGKSTLLAAWRQAIVPLGFDVAWLTAATGDDHPGRFLAGLLAAIAAVDPALVREVAAPPEDLARDDADAVERVAVMLVRAIAAHPRELVLVLDDLHHLHDATIRDTLQWLLDHAPARLHLALATRGAPWLSLDRLRSDSQILELDRDDLRFTPEEAARLVAAQAVELDARALKRLYALSDGWVTGLRQLATDWKKKQAEAGTRAGGEAFAGVAPRDVLALTHFFEAEVLARLSPGEIDLLVRASPCTQLSASLCAALLDSPGALASAAALLGRLGAEDLFVWPQEGREPELRHRMHPLLRDTLQLRFEALPAATRQALHARAFGWFRDRGRHADAVRHAVLAGEPGLAAELIAQCAPSLIVRGERRELIALLQRLPPEQVRASPRMRLWLARTQLYLRELEACAGSLDALDRDLPAKDSAGRFEVATLRAALAVQRDDTDAALALLPRLLQPPADADALSVGGRNNILSWLYMHQGAYDRARRVQEEAPPLMIDGAPLVATASGSLHGRCLVGLSHALEGQMTQAERIYRAVAAEAEQIGQAASDTYHLAIALLGDVLYELNDAPQARALLEDKVELLERISIPDALLRVLRLLGSAHWQAGDPHAAFGYLDRLEKHAAAQGLDRLLAHSLADQLHYRLLLGELTAAEALLARLDAIDARHPDAASNALGEISDLAQRSRIRLAQTLGDLDGAASRLERLIAQCEARGRQRAVAQLLVKAAVVDSGLGRQDSARQKLLGALRRGHRLGLMRSLLDADPAARKLIRELAQTQALDPVLAFYVERLQAARTQARAAEADSAGDGAAPAGFEAFSEREVEVLRLLAQAMPNKKIARALGLSPETVKWYLSRIYAKLRVAGRDEAVARVRDLGWDAERPAGGPPPTR
ncbi:LuxR C-terminal-related transcriptional regulator [Variovorax saccharolyticus]|uniref:LuxR C-terminal-related transcriptional regulator n=1 Tax=Variovorax saccharolyticus TaxID=3053516 RepID=UPI0025782207|nr:LuxR C-terminal-related transcriptional regulator [Variovorax sp. J22R187]MDM0021104.1 LuxR C-terminal-related transcriptional regulator [Variovorax sp. J22R187]